MWERATEIIWEGEMQVESGRSHVENHGAQNHMSLANSMNRENLGGQGLEKKWEEIKGFGCLERSYKKNKFHISSS